MGMGGRTVRSIGRLFGTLGCLSDPGWIDGVIKAEVEHARPRRLQRINLYLKSWADAVDDPAHALIRDSKRVESRADELAAAGVVSRPPEF